MIDIAQQLVHFAGHQIKLRLGNHQYADIVRHLLRQREIKTAEVKTALLKLGAEQCTEIEIGNAIQFAFAMPIQIHHGLITGVGKAQQGAGKDRLIDLGEVFAASGIFDHHFAIEADLCRTGFFRFFFGIDEYQLHVGLVALIERQEIANDLADVTQARVLFSCIHRDCDRPAQLPEHFHAAGFQTIAGVVGHIALNRIMRREIAQARRNT